MDLRYVKEKISSVCFYFLLVVNTTEAQKNMKPPQVF